MAPRTTSWRAIVTYALPPGELTDDIVDALVTNLPGYGAATADEGEHPQLQLQMTVEASTARQAVDAALPAARAAHTAAYGTAGEPVAVRVLTDDEYQREMARPRTLDLVGATEIGEMLFVSRQRAAELAAKNAAFPPPVGTTLRGPVYTRDSVALFAKHWDRGNPGGRPPKADGGAR